MKEKKSTIILKKLCLVLMSLILLSSAAFGDLESNLVTQLKSQGFNVISVDLDGDIPLISYTVSDFKNIDEGLEDIAFISKIAKTQTSKDDILIIQTFDDNQKMEILVKNSYAMDFIDKKITAEEFSLSLEFRPLTRGTPLVPVLCDAKNNCLTDTVNCGCFEGQICNPKLDKANSWGCYDEDMPANAVYTGTEYECIENYVWNSDSSSCVLKETCKQGFLNFNGECISPDDINADSSNSNLFLGFVIIALVGFFIFLIGAGIIGLIIYLVIKSSKKKSSKK